MKHSSLRIIREEHLAVGAMLQSLRQMVQRGPGDEPERYFDVLRAMLFYIDEFPEKLHHPKESDLLFPKIVRREPQLLAVIERLDRDHMHGERMVREVQHLLLAWELLGESRRAAFTQAADQYLSFYIDHMRTEETQVLPVAERVLSEADWAELDRAFESHQDPFTGDHANKTRDAIYDRLYTRIVTRAPAPIGLGT